MKLQTERLILRDLEMKDAKELAKKINNLKISGNLLVVPYPYTLKNAKSFISHCIKKSKEKPRESYELAIILKGEKSLIGVIGISKIDMFQGSATIGYWLAEEYWRQGIMSEALNEVINFYFSKLKMRRINISAFGENKGSNELIKKMGFKYEGTRIKQVRDKAAKKLHDHVMYGMLREEWKK